MEKARHILFGDSDPLSLYHELALKPLSFGDFLEDESLLLNLYLHSIKDGAKLVRTPALNLNTAFRSNDKAQKSPEVFFNLAVSKAKEAVIKSRQDVLVCGVLSPGLIEYYTAKNHFIKNVSESIIFLDDFEVDCILLQDFKDIEPLELALVYTAKLTNLPVAIFCDAQLLKSKKIIDKLNKLALDFNLDLLGLDGRLADIDLLEKITPSTSKGFILNEMPNVDDFYQLSSSQKLSLDKLTMYLGGRRLKRGEWKIFKTALISYIKNLD